MELKVCRHTENVPECQNGSVVAIGNFDGVHKGHQSLISHTVEKAEELGVPAVILTFEPHPRKVFMGDKFEGRVTPFADKAKLLEALGIHLIYNLRFTKKYSSTQAEHFIEETLLKTLNAKHVVVGRDFCFGAKRLGDVHLLEKYGESHGFSVEAFGEIQDTEGERFASSVVRKFLSAGDVISAQEQLGRFHEVTLDLFEDDMCNLKGVISKYCKLKNAVYMVKISYTGHHKQAGEHLGIIPVAVKNGHIIIPPMKELPDIPEGRYALEFLDLLDK